MATASLGDILREAREARGLTPDEVERATRIRAKYVEALEHQQFDELPGDVYTRGFLRNYALFLGLPVAEVVAAYEAVLAPARGRLPRLAPATAPAAKAPPVVDPGMVRPLAPPVSRVSRAEAGRIQPVSPTPIDTRLRYAPSCTVTSALAVVLLIAFYLIYSTVTSSQKIQPTPTPRSATPTSFTALLPTVLVSRTPIWTPLPTPGPSPPPVAPTATAGPALTPGAPTPPGTGLTPGTSQSPTPARPPVAGQSPGPTVSATPGGRQVMVEITIQQPVWFRVFVDDVKVFEGTLPKGTVRSWSGARMVQIRTGRADIVHIKVNGQDRGLLGSPQQTVVTKQWDVNGNETIVQ